MKEYFSFMIIPVGTEVLNISKTNIGCGGENGKKQDSRNKIQPILDTMQTFTRV